MVPESAVSSPQAHHYYLFFSGQLAKVLTVVAGMLFQPSLILLMIHDDFCFFVSDPLSSCSSLLPSFANMSTSSFPGMYRRRTGKDVEFLVLGPG